MLAGELGSDTENIAKWLYEHRRQAGRLERIGELRSELRSVPDDLDVEGTFPRLVAGRTLTDAADVATALQRRMERWTQAAGGRSRGDLIAGLIPRVQTPAQRERWLREVSTVAAYRDRWRNSAQSTLEKRAQAAAIRATALSGQGAERQTLPIPEVAAEIRRGVDL